MKNFFYKISFFLLLIALTCILIEVLVRQIPNEYRFKREYLDKNSDKIEMLFLGGSHARAGLDPVYTEIQSFNAAHASQSLDYDWEIIKKYRNSWSSLEYIVLPVSYASLFYKIEGSMEPWRVKNYVLYYRIVITKHLRYHTEILNGLLFEHFKRLGNFYFKKIDEIKCSKLGWGILATVGNQNDLVRTGIEAAQRHTIPVDRQDCEEMKSALDSIVDFSKRNNIKLIMITTPAYISYRANLDQRQMDHTVQTILNIVRKNDNCHYFNMIDDKAFTEEDFSNGDHLNGSGARKLTLMIDSIVESKGFNNHSVSLR
jgi:hypothetical protein